MFAGEADPLDALPPDDIPAVRSYPSTAEAQPQQKPVMPHLFPNGPLARGLLSPAVLSYTA